MFGLPVSTVYILFGVPAIWVLYTLIFVYVSRHWAAEDSADAAPLSAGQNTDATTQGVGAA